MPFQFHSALIDLWHAGVKILNGFLIIGGILSSIIASSFVSTSLLFLPRLYSSSTGWFIISSGRRSNVYVKVRSVAKQKKKSLYLTLQFDSHFLSEVVVVGSLIFVVGLHVYYPPVLIVTVVFCIDWCRLILLTFAIADSLPRDWLSYQQEQHVTRPHQWIFPPDQTNTSEVTCWLAASHELWTIFVKLTPVNMIIKKTWAGSNSQRQV